MRPRALVLASILTALAGAGCGPAYLVPLFTSGGSGDSGSSGHGAPAVEVTSSAAREDLKGPDGVTPSATEIRIDYRAIDSKSSAVSLEVLWRRASEPDAAFRPAAAGSGSDPTTGLSTAPDPGASHHFVWAAETDLGVGVEEDVVLRFTLLRGDVAGVPKEIALRAGNAAPTVTIVPQAGALGRQARTQFAVTDSSSDAWTVRLFIRDLAGGPQVEVPNIDVVSGSILWDPTAVFGIRNLTAEIEVRAKEVLFGLEGRAVATIAIGTDTAPAASITSFGFPGKSVRGRVPFTVVATDAEAALDPAGSGKVDLDVRFSVEGGPPKKASLLAIGSGTFDAGGSVRGLPVGVFPDLETGKVRLLWDVAADVGKTPPGGWRVRLEVTPRNTIAGQSAPFDTIVDDPLEFEEVATLFGSPGPRHAVVADFLMDGVHDILIPGSGAFFTQQLFLGSSSGYSFNSSGPPTYRLAPADFSGRGFPTLAGLVGKLVLNQAGDQNRFLANDVRIFDPFFNASEDFPLTGIDDAFALAVGDFDGDGIQDVAVASNGPPSKVFVMRGLGGGQLAAPVVVASDPGGLFGGLFFFFYDPNNQAQFPFCCDLYPSEQWVSSLTAIDLTGDAIPDLVLFGANTGGPGHVATLRGHGDAQFTFDFVADDSLGGDAADIAFADFNGDRIPDYVVLESGPSTGTKRFRVALGRRDPTTGRGSGRFDLLPPQVVGPFVPFADGPQSASDAIAVSDLDGDGIPDILVTDGDVVVFHGRGDGTFDRFKTFTPSFGVPVGVTAIEPFDNGVPGFLTIGRLGDVHLFQRKDRPFEEVSLIDVPGTPEFLQPTLVAGDFNGDGRPGFAVLHRDSGANVLLGRGDGHFDPATAVPPLHGAPVGFPSMAIAPFSLGVYPDLAVITEQGDGVDILRNDGGGSFERIPLIDPHSVAGKFISVGAGDFDRDGIPDLVLIDIVSRELALFAGRGDGLFDPKPPIPTPDLFGLRTQIVDVNGDGIPDLVIPGFSFSQPIQVLIGHGDFTFDAVSDAVPAGLMIFDFQVADLTGDGIPDMVLTGQGTAVLRGRGDGHFDLLGGGAASPIHLAVGDLAGDGVPQVVGFDFRDVVLIQGERPRPGAPARGERGGGNRYSIHTMSRVARVLEHSDRLALGGFLQLDATPDGLTDLAVADLPNRAVHVLGSSGLASSRPLALAGAAPPPGFEADDFRVVHTLPLDLALCEPGRVATPTAGMRLAPASLATTVSPDRARFAAPFDLTLPLFAALTRRELETGVIHVYRYERAEISPSQPWRTGQIVEVASTATTRPAGIELAKVDPDAGTIRFPVTRLGTFESLLEVPVGTLPIFRETFDDAPLVPGAIDPPLPDGWIAAGRTWQVGPPAAGTAPAPSSTNVLGTSLRSGRYRDGADDTVVSPTFVFGRPVGIPPGARLMLRCRTFVALAGADVVTVEGPGSTGLVVVASFDATANTGSVFADTVIDLTPVADSGVLKLVFRLTSGASGGDSGFYVDDIDIVMEQ